jgi:MATE family multidrug resistance protein
MTESRQLISLAIPAIIAQLAQMGMGVVDTIMAGHYSAEALAAIAMATNLMNPAIIFVLGILLALNPMVAHLNGEENWLKIRVLFQSGMLLALLLSIPSFFVLRSFEPVLVIIGLDDSVIEVTQGYLAAISWGMPALYLFLALRFANEGLFSNQAIMLIALSALPLNVLLNQWFMYGGLGVPAMGVVGLGWATDIVYCYLFVTLLIFTHRTRRYHHIGIFAETLKPNINVIKEAIKVGIPIGLSTALEVGLFAAVGLMIGSYGIAQIAGHQIAINITSFGYMVPLGLSIAITTRVGFHMGRGKPLEAKSSGYLGIIMSFALMLFNATLLIYFPSAIAAIYSSDNAVITVASQLLFFAALLQLSDGTQVAAMAALRGMKDTKTPLLITLFSYWIIGFPMGYWFAEIQGYGVKGYWLAIICGLTVAAMLLAGRFIYLINQRTGQWLNEHQTGS